jgi:hypothetical protein
MQNELLVRMSSCPSVFSCLRATVMAISSAMLFMCLSGYDLTSMCVVVCALGFTTPAPSVLLPLIFDPPVYTKSLGSHFPCCGLV